MRSSLILFNVVLESAPLSLCDQFRKLCHPMVGEESLANNDQIKELKTMVGEESLADNDQIKEL